MTESDNDESPKTLKNVERVDFESMLNISKHDEFDPYESSSPRKKQPELQINCVDYPVIKEKRDIFQTPRTSRPQQN